MADGIEVECSVLGNGEPEASTPGRDRDQDADWYDYEAKYTAGGMELVVPAPIPTHAASGCASSPSRSFRLVGCAGHGARRLLRRPTRAVLVNELNTIPGFTATSVYAKLWEASGVPYPELLDRLLRLALERHERERPLPLLGVHRCASGRAGRSRAERGYFSSSSSDRCLAALAAAR